MKKQLAEELENRLVEISNLLEGKKRKPEIILTEKIWKKYNKKIIGTIKFFSKVFKEILDNLEIDRSEQLAKECQSLYYKIPSGKIEYKDVEWKEKYPKSDYGPNSLEENVKKLKNFIFKTLPFYDLVETDNIVKFNMALVNQLKEDINIIVSKYMNKHIDAREYLHESINGLVRKSIIENIADNSEYRSDIAIIEQSLITEIALIVEELLIRYKEIVGNFDHIPNLFLKLAEKQSGYMDYSDGVNFMYSLCNYNDDAFDIMINNVIAVINLRHDNTNSDSAMRKLRSYRLLSRFAATMRVLLGFKNQEFSYRAKNINESLDAMKRFIESVDRSGGSHNWVSWFLTGERDFDIEIGKIVYGNK